MHDVVTIETAGLGDRSYLVHDGEHAAVIDAQRDIDRVLAVAEAAAVRITHVLETHIHNDYVTGGLALARSTGADYVVAAAEDVSFGRVPAGDGDRFCSGRLTLTAMATPGHTPGHLSYVLRADQGAPAAVFTGGSLLYGAVGRTDLIGPDQTVALTRAQYPGPAPRGRSARPGGRVPHARVRQFLLRDACQRDFLNDRCRTGGEYRADQRRGKLRQGTAGRAGRLSPLLRAHGPANRRGPAAPDLTSPRTAGPDELRRRIGAGEWVVDLRQRRAFAGLHLTGSISVESGDPFATYLGWTIAWAPRSP